MKYLNTALLESFDAQAFQAVKPYPWLNPKGFLTEEGFHHLVENLPTADQFDRRFGEVRKHGQQNHDRLSLDYRPELPMSKAWHEFVGELEGPGYRRFLNRMFGRGALRLVYHWHYTPNGCSVSPHCDARRKLGSHIFYLNTEKDWRAEWGGETLILDDGGRIPADSAPQFEEFDRVIPAETMDNRSLLFMRREQSWHGVREINCPPAAFRKVFIVVIEDWSLPARLKSLFRGSKRRSY
ncbi:MAG: 2OG-Fe(II) oxygenase [Dongiaceae bacterium]